MENVVYWRRKLLDFDPDGSPNKHYVPIDIPRYYSSFYPWFRMFWTPECPRKNICSPSYKEVITYPTQFKFHDYPKFKVDWFLFLMVSLVLLVVLFFKK